MTAGRFAFVVAVLVPIACGAAPAVGPRAGAERGTTAPSSSRAPSSSDVTKELALGDRAPAFRRASVNGMGAVVVPNGKPTLLYLFAFDWGGGPGAKAVEELRKRYASRGLVVVGVAFDVSAADDRRNAEDVGRSATSDGLGFPVTWSAPRDIPERYRPESTAQLYVLDASGRLRFTHVVGRQPERALDPEVTAAVEDVLGAW
jgi:hypothetical protein